MADERYLKALRFDALTPLYDFVIRHAEFKRHLVRQVDIHNGQRILISAAAPQRYRSL